MEIIWSLSLTNFSTKLRFAVSNAIYFVMALSVTVVTLIGWEKYRADLPSWDPPFLDLFSYALFVGTFVFGTTSWAILKFVDSNRDRMGSHLSAAGILYALAIYGIYKIVFYPPVHPEGFDIAFRVFVFAAIYGIICNGIVVQIHKNAT